jgi:ribosomal-protein-alanine N-acetyltransferase
MSRENQNENSNDIRTEDFSTERILMSKFMKEDINEFFEIVKKHEVGEWLGLGKGMSFEETEGYISRILKHWTLHNFGVWALKNKSNKEIMGHCGLRYIDDTEDIEIIYLLDPKYWGKGIATEAGNEAVQYAFNILKIDKLLARIRPNNSRSKNVINKIGFKFIGDRKYDDRILSYYELYNSDTR